MNKWIYGGEFNCFLNTSEDFLSKDVLQNKDKHGDKRINETSLVIFG